jgi:hypothetical protein
VDGSQSVYLPLMLSTGGAVDGRPVGARPGTGKCLRVDILGHVPCDDGDLCGVGQHMGHGEADHSGADDNDVHVG